MASPNTSGSKKISTYQKPAYYLIPEKEQGADRTLALMLVEHISANYNDGSWKWNLVARIESLCLPLVLGFSIAFEKAPSVIGSFYNQCFLFWNKSEGKSFLEEGKELVLYILALGSQVVICPFAVIISPKILVRPEAPEPKEETIDKSQVKTLGKTSEQNSQQELLEGLQEKISQLEEDKRQLDETKEREIKTQKRQVEELQKQVSKLEEDKRQLDEAKGREIEAQKRQVEELQEKISQLEEDKRQLGETKEREIEAQKRQVEELQKQVSKLEEDKRQLGETKGREIETQKRRLEELQEQVSQLETEKGQLGETKEREIKTQKRQVEELQEKISQLEEDKRQLGETKEREIKTQKRQVEELQKQVSKLEAEKGQLGETKGREIETQKEQVKKLSEENKKLLEDKKRELETLKTHYKKQIDRLDQEKLDLTQQIKKIQAARGVDESQKKNKGKDKSTSIQDIPTITGKNLKTFQDFIAQNKIQGVSVTVQSYDPIQVPNVQTWGMSVNIEKRERELMKHKGYKSPFDQIQDKGYVQKKCNLEKEEFLSPEGTLSMEIDPKEGGEKWIVPLMTLPHHLNRLHIKNFTFELIKGLEKGGVLSKIHTLALSTDAPIEIAPLLKIAQDYPNIVCFDLSGAEVKEELASLKRNHIVIPHKNNGKDNISEKLNELNVRLFNLVQNYTQDKATTFLKGFSEGGMIATHPAAPFITNVSFLKGMPIRERVFQGLVPKLKLCFPNIRVLNLSKCDRLDVSALRHIKNHLKVKKLYLLDCPLIQYQRFYPKELEYERIGKLKKEGEWYFDSQKLVLMPGKKPGKAFPSFTHNQVKVLYDNPTFGSLKIHDTIQFKDQFFSLSNSTIEVPRARYRICVDKDTKRAYHFALHEFISELKHLYEIGCDYIHIGLNQVEQEAIERSIWQTVQDSCKQRGEVKIAYSIGNETFEYPTNTSSAASSSSSSSS